MFNKTLIIISSCILLPLVALTVIGLTKLPSNLDDYVSKHSTTRYLDKDGIILTRSYQNSFNAHDLIDYTDVSEFFVKALIASEDKRFFNHSGVDWLAKLNAIFINTKNFRIVRGASTITEQVVRIINPRKRVLWSKWLEFIDAYRLERKYSKIEILEFFINQVPFSSNRRGLSQASNFYFGRSFSTLIAKEKLALVILIRAPGLFNLNIDSSYVEKRIPALLEAMVESGYIKKYEARAISKQQLELRKSIPLDVKASHFVRYMKSNYDNIDKLVKTTIDGELQNSVQKIVNNHIKDLSSYNVSNSGALVVNHKTGEVLSWAVGAKNKEENYINAVTTPRQPGSTLKPFVYAMAFDKGWNSNTLIIDEPIYEAVYGGIHKYNNFSNNNYGEVTIRKALGNSLNIPAVKTLEYVGVDNFISKLKELGFTNINRSKNFYGKGIVLGNSEVSLLELVQAYTAIARDGTPIALKFADGFRTKLNSLQSFKKDSVDEIKSILVDSYARHEEFGMGSILNFPVLTAIKTGTSSSSRDVWAIAFDKKYIVGVWVGNLDATYTKELTGASGAVQLVRSIFKEINNKYGYNGLNVKQYNQLTENLKINKTQNPYFIKPTHNMEIIYSPRISDDLQAFEFELGGIIVDDKIIWKIDDKIYITNNSKYLWKLEKGIHTVSALIYRDKKEFLIKKRKFSVR